MDIVTMAETLIGLLESYGPVAALLVALNAILWAWLYISGRIVSASQHRDIKDQLAHCQESAAFWRKAAWGTVAGAERLLPGGGGDGE